MFYDTGFGSKKFQRYVYRGITAKSGQPDPPASKSLTGVRCIGILNWLLEPTSPHDISRKSWIPKIDDLYQQNLVNLMLKYIERISVLNAV